jgi:hypothetical protein
LGQSVRRQAVGLEEVFGGFTSNFKEFMAYAGPDVMPDVPG